MIGKDTLINSEITNISLTGFWVLVDDKEYFVAFNEYPMFKTMSVNDIFNMKMLSPEQLHWERADIDIELSALKNPEKFRLLYK